MAGYAFSSYQKILVNKYVERIGFTWEKKKCRNT